MFFAIISFKWFNSWKLGPHKSNYRLLIQSLCKIPFLAKPGRFQVTLQFALPLTRFIIHTKFLLQKFGNTLQWHVGRKWWRYFCLFCFYAFFNFASIISHTVLNRVLRSLWFKNKWNQLVIWKQGWNWPSNWPGLNFSRIVKCKVLEVIRKLETEKDFQSKVPLAKLKIKSCSIEEMIIWRRI